MIAALTARRILLAAALFAALTSCSSDGSLAVDGEVPVGCETDDDCVTGTCQFGICATNAVAELQVALLIEPPAFRDELGPLHVTDLPVTLGTDVPDFALRQPASVRGVVLFNTVGEDVGTPVEAEVLFVGRRGIPGFEFEAFAHSAATGEYSLLVPPGAYDVSIEPDRADVSRTTASDVEIRSGSEFTSFSIPAPSQYRIVSGVVERQEDALVPVPSARVFARTVDGRQESTVNTTGADGRFVLLVPPSELPYVLNVRPTGDSSMVPSATFEPITLAEDGSVTDVRLSLGTFAPPVEFEVCVETPDGAPVPAAAFLATAALEPAPGGLGGPDLAGGGYSQFVLGGVDDAGTPVGDLDGSGCAAVALPPGRAEVHAAAMDPELGLAVPRVIALDDDLAGTSVHVAVEQRHRVTGVVRTPGGDRAVAGAEVRASLRSSSITPLDRYPLPSSAFSDTAVTSEEGTFVLLAQPGTWEVVVTPPVSSGFSRQRAVIEVERGPVDGVVVELAESGVVRGRVLDGTNAPLAGATVRVFSVDGDEVVALGEAATDADGVYRLVLPVE